MPCSVPPCESPLSPLLYFDWSIVIFFPRWRRACWSENPFFSIRRVVPPLIYRTGPFGDGCDSFFTPQVGFSMGTLRLGFRPFLFFFTAIGFPAAFPPDLTLARASKEIRISFFLFPPLVWIDFPVRFGCLIRMPIGPRAVQPKCVAYPLRPRRQRFPLRDLYVLPQIRRAASI